MTRHRTSLSDSTTSQDRGADRFVRRLVSATLIILLFQLGTAAWFMVGQGYDRATAGLVPWMGLVAAPLMAWLIRVGMPRGQSHRGVRMGQALAMSVALYLAGVFGPAWIILNVLDLGSPFTEFWWILGSISTSLVMMLTLQKAPEGRQRVFGAFLAVGGGAGILLMRAFVFSFF